MKIALIGAEMEENLALRYLAAVLSQSGHEPRIIAFDNSADSDQVVKEAVSFAPHLVGLSMAFQYRALEFVRIAKSLRENKFPGHITAGGHFPTFEWKSLLERVPEIDSVIRYEGEIPLLRLVESLEKSLDLIDIPGLAFRASSGVKSNPPIRWENLDTLPFPLRNESFPRHLSIASASVIGSRGCYGSCDFCCIQAYHRNVSGPAFRLRNPENIADEIALLRFQKDVRVFNFHDDNFLPPNRENSIRRVKDLIRALRAREVNDAAFLIKCRPNDVDLELFSLLKELGVIRVFVGVENVSNSTLKVLGRNVDRRQIEKALELLDKLGFYSMFNFMLWGPETTISEIDENIAFMETVADIPYKFCRAEVYSGTPMFERLSTKGALSGDMFGWEYQGADPRSELLFRMAYPVFANRCFDNFGLTNMNVDMGYYGALVEKFYPHRVSSELRAQIKLFNRQVNSLTLRTLKELRDITEKASSEPDESFLNGAVSELAERTNREDFDLRPAFHRLEAICNGVVKDSENRNASQKRAGTLAASVVVALLGLNPSAAPSANAQSAVYNKAESPLRMVSFCRDSRVELSGRLISGRFQGSPRVTSGFGTVRIVSSDTRRFSVEFKADSKDEKIPGSVTVRVAWRLDDGQEWESIVDLEKGVSRWNVSGLHHSRAKHVPVICEMAPDPIYLNATGPKEAPKLVIEQPSGIVPMSGKQGRYKGKTDVLSVEAVIRERKVEVNFTLDDGYKFDGPCNLSEVGGKSRILFSSGLEMAVEFEPELARREPDSCLTVTWSARSGTNVKSGLQTTVSFKIKGGLIEVIGVSLRPTYIPHICEMAPDPHLNPDGGSLMDKKDDREGSLPFWNRFKSPIRSKWVEPGIIELSLSEFPDLISANWKVSSGALDSSSGSRVKWTVSEKGRHWAMVSVFRPGGAAFPMFEVIV